MPPYSTVTTTMPVEEIPLVLENRGKTQKPLTEDLKRSYKTLWGNVETELIWTNIIFISLLHFFAVLVLLTFPYFSKPKTFIFATLYGSLGGFGVTAGAHRLWCHRSYKAKLPLRIILIICYAIAGQNKLYDWVRDHRVHHKYSETDADPHNSNRGFFFAHVGWLFMKKHPEVLKHGKKINCSDLFQDGALVFHDKYFFPMKIIFCFLIPMVIPHYLWYETWYWCVTGCVLTRLAFNLNCTWSVNSFAHIFGTRPYNKDIRPTENLAVSFFAMGEGYHNYHHTFPWDYKAAELGNYNLNVTTLLLDVFAKIGWAYDLKTPSKELILKVMERNGDRSYCEQEEISGSVDIDIKNNRFTTN